MGPRNVLIQRADGTKVVRAGARECPIPRAEAVPVGRAADRQPSTPPLIRREPVEYDFGLGALDEVEQPRIAVGPPLSGA